MTLNWGRRFGYPDLIVFGLEPAAARALMRETLSALQAGEIEIADGLQLPGLDPPGIWRTVHPDWTATPEGFFELAFGRSASAPLGPYLQLVTADTAGRFPWDDDYAHVFIWQDDFPREDAARTIAVQPYLWESIEDTVKRIFTDIDPGMLEYCD